MEFDIEFGLLIDIPPDFSGIAMGTCEYNVAPPMSSLAAYSAYTTPFSRGTNRNTGANVGASSTGGKQLNIPLQIHDHEVHLSNDNYTVEETSILNGIANTLSRWF